MAQSKKRSTSSKKKSSSSSYSSSKAAKKAIKYAKKNPKGAAFLVIVALVLLAAAAAGYWYYDHYIDVETYLRLVGGDVVSVGLETSYAEKGAVAVYKDKDISDQITIAYFKGSTPVSSIETSIEDTYSAIYSVSYEDFTSSITRTINVVDTEPLSISFLELGNKFTGDCTYIKAGDTDILIDAGSRQSSAETIENYIDNYVDDGKIEYVIATHAHQDHIAGFVGTSGGKSILDDYKIGTLIDFSKTTKSTEIYKNYNAKRDSHINSGDIDAHYTALQCVQNKDGASSTYEVATGITMTILDQKFYHETAKNENDNSVCLLFTQGENSYLFTGDLEEKGEASLVEKNDLPKVQLFKGGHHGSYTANTDKLLNVIQPETVCICCCAGSSEYTSIAQNMFPAQASINRMAKWTKNIYVTTVVSNNEDGFESMNGNIVVQSSKGKDYTVTGSNNSVILKDTAWFQSNRTWPSNGVQ